MESGVNSMQWLSALPAWLVVALGGAVGAVLRFVLGRAALFLYAGSWPLGTFLVNIMGCVLMGVIYGMSLQQPLPEQVRLFLMTGLLGGFTTFSAFSLESIILLQQGRIVMAASYSLLTLLLTILAIWLGMALTRG